MRLIDREFVQSMFVPRKTSSAKWDHGHALIIAGSIGMAGAAVLASRACLRSGVGLLTTHVPEYIASALMGHLPEAMLSLDMDRAFSDVPILDKYTAIGIGPGIGVSNATKMAFEILLDRVSVPVVIDADGLNILSSNHNLLSKIPKHAILTPHYGEFSRLINRSWDNDQELILLAMEFAQRYSLILVLKSSKTRIFTPDGSIFCNVTGNSGLAKGGSGDALLGMVTSFLAQGYESICAACLAVYIHGYAADLTNKSLASESMLASDVIEKISDALLDLTN